MSSAETLPSSPSNEYASVNQVDEPHARPEILDKLKGGWIEVVEGTELVDKEGKSIRVREEEFNTKMLEHSYQVDPVSHVVAFVADGRHFEGSANREDLAALQGEGFDFDDRVPIYFADNNLAETKAA